MVTNRCVSLAGLTPSLGSSLHFSKNVQPDSPSYWLLGSGILPGLGVPHLASPSGKLPQPKRPWMVCCCHTCTSSPVIPAPPAAFSCAGSERTARRALHAVHQPAERCPPWGPA